MKTDAEYRRVFAQHGLALPEGEVLDARWMMRTDEWWCRTAAGWFWYEERAKRWKLAPLGPY